MKGFFMNKMLLIKKIIFFGMLILMCGLLYSQSSAANIYVDQTLSSDCIANNYSVTNRNCTGSDGNAYSNFRIALTHLASGNDMYLRGGTYTATTADGSGSSGAVWNLPFAANGTSSKWTTLQSYPGEWAILDGNSQYGHGVVLGYKYTDSTLSGAADYHHWLIQRLEITGGSGTVKGEAGGIWMNGGPNIFRYLYIHDNTNASQDENPNGLTGKIWHDVIVEYNYFKNNGCPIGAGTNCSHIAIYTDYKWDTRDIYDINHAVRSNTIRYNLFDGSEVGFKHKGGQQLGDDSGTDMRYKDYGDKIHHNIFLNSSIAIMARQDFIQVNNNISDGGRIEDQDVCSTCSQTYNTTIYNNTVLSSYIGHPVPYATPLTLLKPYLWFVNNIVDTYTNTWDSSSITVGHQMAITGGSIDITNAKINNNFVYRPGSSTHYSIGRGLQSCSEFLSTADMNRCYSTSNYTNATSGLYKGSSGADKYITNGSFVIGSTTIANGGIGGNHPYLLGVKFPSYVGATNPNDQKNNAWVNGVLSLSNVNVLKESKGIPSWSPSTVGWQ
jgi:hypothetical protein